MVTYLACGIGALIGWPLGLWLEGRWHAHRRTVSRRPPRSPYHHNPRSPRYTDRTRR